MPLLYHSGSVHPMEKCIFSIVFLAFAAHRGFMQNKRALPALFVAILFIGPRQGRIVFQNIIPAILHGPGSLSEEGIQPSPILLA